MLQEILKSAKKELHDVIVDFLKRKRHTNEVEGTKTMNTFMGSITTKGFEVNDEDFDSHYMRPHYARETIQTLLWINDVMLCC